jgi:hypothetical protein
MGRPEAGYGGFGIRFAPREGTAIRTDAGQEARDTNLVPHAWAALEGDFAGRHAGARIDDDAANPGFPNGWCLRLYGFLGVDFPGVRMYDIQPGAPLVLKYQVSVFSAPR